MRTDSGVKPPKLSRNGDFLKFWSGQALSQLGAAVTAFAMPILVLDLTGSASQAGTVLAVQQVPYLLLGLFAGVVVDRVNRKALMVWMDTIRAALVGLIAFLCFAQSVSIYALMAVGVVMGIAYTLFDVADNSAFPSLVTRKQLPRAASLAEGGATAADLLGPALAGVVISAFASVQAGVGGAYVINAFTFVVAAGFVAAIRRPLTPPARDTSAPSGVLKEIQHGILFLWRDKRLRAMAVANLLNCLLLSPIVLLMTAVGRIQLNLDASVLGLIISGGALGGLAGALLTPYIRDRLSARATMICAGGAWIAASLVLAAWPSVWGIIASWALFSLFMPVYFSTLYAYRVLLVPDGLQGRVNSAYRLLAQGGTPLGALLGGISIERFGSQTTALVFAVGFLVASIIAWGIGKDAEGTDDE